MGEENWVSDFAAFFQDLEGFFPYKGSGLLLQITPKPHWTLSVAAMPCLETCLVHPEGPLDLNTSVPGAKQLAGKNLCA